ncbi:MAG: hypothetical protein U1C74_22635 [Phenylobacterium sp.]|nr:hypothetical protein [Phenylobacterium sp.]
MEFVLSALGQELAWPGLVAVNGAVEDAVREAEALLALDPACEEVEIFSEGRFVVDLSRRVA